MVLNQDYMEKLRDLGVLEDWRTVPHLFYYDYYGKVRYFENIKVEARYLPAYSFFDLYAKIPSHVKVNGEVKVVRISKDGSSLSMSVHIPLPDGTKKSIKSDVNALECLAKTLIYLAEHPEIKTLV